MVGAQHLPGASTGRVGLGWHMSPRRPGTPTLDQLSLPEQGELLGQLLAIHPGLLADAERLARTRLAADVAGELEWALRGVDVDQLAYRAGRVHGRGYVHENAAASELLDQALDRYLTDLACRAALGLTGTEEVIGCGLLTGLANCESDVEDGSVLAYAGPDAPGELAWSVCKILKDADVSLPDDAFDALPEGWARLL